MNTIKLYIPLTLVIFFSACSPDNKDTTQNSSSTSQNSMSVDAGDDKRVKINETVTIVGKGTVTDGSQLSFTWKKGSDTLATTAKFDYTPTVLGTDTLTLIAQHNSGKTIQDSMRVFVVEKDVDSSSIPTISDADKKEYLYQINKARSQEQDCGTEGIFPATHELTWSDKLYKASYEHTQDLVATNTFSHSGSGKESDWTGTVLGKRSTPSERIESYGYSWQTNGENIGAGTVIDSAKKMVQGWLNSPHHCANLMSPNFKEVGMAMIKDENRKYTHYWTQNFGTQR